MPARTNKIRMAAILNNMTEDEFEDFQTELWCNLPAPEVKAFPSQQIEDIANTMREKNKELTQTDIDRLNKAMFVWS